MQAPLTETFTKLAASNIALLVSGLTVTLVPLRVLIAARFDTNRALQILSVADRFQLLSSTVFFVVGLLSGWGLLISLVLATRSDRISGQVSGSVGIVVSAGLLILTQPLVILVEFLLLTILSLAILRRSGYLVGRRAKLRKLKSDWEEFLEQMKQDETTSRAGVLDLRESLRDLSAAGPPRLSNLARQKFAARWKVFRSNIPKYRYDKKIESLGGVVTEIDEKINNLVESQTKATNQISGINSLLKTPKTLFPESLGLRLSACGLAIALGSSLVIGNWVPLEHINYGGRSDVGYVMGETRGRILFLTKSGGITYWIDDGVLRSRYLCTSETLFVFRSFPNLIGGTKEPTCRPK